MDGIYEKRNLTYEQKESLKFLILNNSDSMIKIIQNTLKKLGYWNLVEAKNDEDARYKLYSESPDLIVTDLSFPGKSGINFVQTIRRDEKYWNIPILMVTTRGTKQTILEGLKAKVDSFVIQPVTPRKVKEKIEQVLSQNGVKN